MLTCFSPSNLCASPEPDVSHSFVHYVSLQKEENGKIVSTLPPDQNQFIQSGLGPGQEYEVSVNIIKNNTRGPQTTEKVTTSEFVAVNLIYFCIIKSEQVHPVST